MLDILQDYLRSAATPELGDVLISAHATFERLELENYEQSFEELLMTDDQVGENETVGLINGLTLQLQRKILLDHSITVTDDITVHQANAIINGILDIPEYSDTAQMLSVLNLDMLPVERLAECLALVTLLTVEDLVMVIEDISLTLLTRIRESMTEREENNAARVPENTVERHAIKIRHFMDMVKTDWQTEESLHSIELFKNGVELGHSFSFYVKQLPTDIETRETMHIACELLVMAFASTDGIEEPRKVIAAAIENIISNPDVIMRVDIELNRLIGDYNGYHG